MALKKAITRFRAYQLGSAGSSFSYFDGSNFTLIEARLTDGNQESIDQELKECGINRIHTLHITSWDQDHCSPKQLEEIIEKYSPIKIEYPGYSPHTQCGKDSLDIIKKYKRVKKGPSKLIQITPEYINSLKEAKEFGYNNIIYHPKTIDKDNSNNNSTVKQFRSGVFNVLSLGDVESSNLAAGLRRYSSIYKEVDIMILAHHGANNGFTTSSFIKRTKPTLAIASADYANKFKHPKQEIRDLLHKNEVKLFTTKTGDVIIKSTNGHYSKYEVINLKAGSTEVSSTYKFVSKKSKFLNSNKDSLRNRYSTKKYKH